MLLGTEANLRKEARDSHPQFSASPLGTPGKTMLIWRQNEKEKKRTACIFRPERSFELKLNGNRGQELQTSVRVALLPCPFKNLWQNASAFLNNQEFRYVYYLDMNFKGEVRSGKIYLY